MHRVNAPIRQFDVRTPEGLRIHACSAGSGPHRWLLTPGLGTPLYSWRYLFEHFKDKLTIVTWEPRGCYQSEPPRDLSRLTVEDHAADGRAVMEAVGWSHEKLLLGGWSMGIEIALEMYARDAARAEGLVLINGAFEHVLETAFSFPGAGTVLPGVLKAAAAGPAVTPLSRHLLSQRWTIELLKRLGLVTANREFFGEVVSLFQELNFSVYFPLMLALNQHSARHILPTVAVPTLVAAGGKDKMTPLSSSRFIQQQIRDAELFVVPDGTHYTTIEYPDVVNRRLEQFFRERVWPRTWDAEASTEDDKPAAPPAAARRASRKRATGKGL